MASSDSKFLVILSITIIIIGYYEDNLQHLLATNDNILGPVAFQLNQSSSGYKIIGVHGLKGQNVSTYL